MGFLNELMPFSLFNATQILSIPIRENLAVLFIVLIVLIVTYAWMKQFPFLWLMWCKFCTLNMKTGQAFVVTSSRRHTAWSVLLSEIYQFFRTEHTRLFKTFKRLITPIEMLLLKTRYFKQWNIRSVDNSANSLYAALLIRLLYKTCLKSSIVICCVLIAYMEN